MKRGSLVIVALRGDSGKPRPALVVQSDLLNETHASLQVCPLTSDLRDAPLFRILVLPDARTGLSLPSQIMVDKVQPVRRRHVGGSIGEVDEATMARVEQSLAFLFALGTGKEN